MERAHKIEAASTQKFFFRKYMAPPDAVESCATKVSTYTPYAYTYISGSLVCLQWYESILIDYELECPGMKQLVGTVLIMSRFGTGI